MTNKEQEVLKQIEKYYNENGYMPSIRYIQKINNYKSPNSIYKIFKSLQNKGYLTNDNHKKKLIIINSFFKEKIKCIKVINTNEVLYLNLIDNKDYLAFKIKKNHFNHLFIKKDDYLIIEKKNKLTNGDLGLFYFNDYYRVMIYQYQDGFYILNDNTQEVLYKVKIIGKIIEIYRRKI